MSLPPAPTVKPRNARRRRSGPTVADVAALAEVSPMTVSRVVNGEKSVQPATRARVEAAIAELGYVPNSAARMLAGARQCSVALLHDNPSAAYLSEFLIGSLDAARRTDAQLVVEDCVGDSPQQVVARLAAHRADAVLLPPPLCDDIALVSALRAAGLAIAQVATGQALPGAVAVTIDDHAAAREMTRHLLALGHRRIGFIAGDPNQTASGLRLEGYRAALGEGGIVPDPALVAPGDFTYRSGLAAAERLLALPDRPTAIFAANDDMAAAAMSAAHRMGLVVPRDLSVCGFDDTAMATTVWPELTTIRQPVADMAREAVRLLVAAVREPGQDRDSGARLAYELIHRASDGPPPPA